MKNLIVLFLLTSSLCFAAITGPFPVGPGVPPLSGAVAVISRIDVILYPVPYVTVTLERFVSKEAFEAGISAGLVSMGDMTSEDFKNYVLEPIKKGEIKTYEEGVEKWLIREGGPLPGWQIIQ